MRLSLFCVLCLLSLSGCVNYAGIHTSAKPYDEAALSQHHSYTLAKRSATTRNDEWWTRFHDPQLNQLIAIALADSPDMYIAKYRLQRAQAVADNSQSLLWPSIDASGYLSRERFPIDGLIPPPFNGKTFNIGEAGLNFNYEFDFWGKNRQALAANLSEVAARQADLAQANLVIATAVATAYFQLQNDIKQHSIANSIYHQRKEIVDIITYRAHHGVESDIPVKTALTDMQTAKVAVDRYQQQEALTRHQLAVLIGKNPLQTDLAVKRFVYHKQHLRLPASMPAHLLARRPDLAAARLRAEAAAHNINVAKAKFYPDINLNILFSYQSIFINKLFSAENQNNAITPAFDLPIFDAGTRRANLRERDAEYDVAVNQYNQSILNALHEVADQLSSLRSLNSQVISQTAALHATAKNYKLVRSRYHHGIVDYIQVLQIKGTWLQQQAAETEYQARQLQATVAMIKALGGDYLSREG